MKDKNRLMYQKLPCGMDFHFLPMDGYQEKMAAIVVKAGANTVQAVSGDKRLTFPKGTAHFLEHRMFRQRWGDAFTEFHKQGAMANAFTDADKTVYYFRCQDYFMENLRLLLSFVQNPYFLDEEIQREKGIIASEITMYQDAPDWAAYYQMLGCMYHTHAIKERIPGSEESIREINKAQLETFFEQFYVPKNMALICAGDISSRDVLAETGMMKSKKSEASSLFFMEKADIVSPYRERSMNLAEELFQIGFKLEPKSKNLLKHRLAFGMALELLTGESSDFQLQAYEKRWLDQPLASGLYCGEGYAFCSFAGKGSKGREISELLQKAVKIMDGRLKAADFERIKRKQIGEVLRQNQSVYSACMGQIAWAFWGMGANDVFRRLKALRKEDVENVLQNEFREDKMVISVIR